MWLIQLQLWLVNYWHTLRCLLLQQPYNKNKTSAIWWGTL